MMWTKAKKAVTLTTLDTIPTHIIASTIVHATATHSARRRRLLTMPLTETTTPWRPSHHRLHPLTVGVRRATDTLRRRTMTRTSLTGRRASLTERTAMTRAPACNRRSRTSRTSRITATIGGIIRGVTVGMRVKRTRKFSRMRKNSRHRQLRESFGRLVRRAQMRMLTRGAVNLGGTTNIVSSRRSRQTLTMTMTSRRRRIRCRQAHRNRTRLTHRGSLSRP